MGRKPTDAKTQSSSAPATSSNTTSKASILRSSFAPSRYQLRLFASIIQSFESQQLRIHDTSNGRSRCQHQIKPNTSVTCLEWGQYNPSRSHSRKKRKSGHNEDVVVAYGTDDSEICMFSPTEGKLVGQLTGGHERGVRDFRFSQQQRDQAWSIGGDGKLVQWNLKTGEVARSISLLDPAIGILSQPSNSDPSILCASTTPYAVGLESEDDVGIQNFDSMKTQIHTLLRSDHDRDGTTELFLTADSGRHIHVYDIDQKRLVRTLIAAGEVLEADLYHGDSQAWNEQLLAITTKDGLVELFPRPFVQPSAQNGELKSNRKSLTQKASAKVQLINTDSKSSRAPIFAASLQGPDLLVASVDSGVEISFQKVRWQDEGTGELLFDGTKEVVRNKAASSLNTASTHGVKDLGKSQVDESKTVVVNGIAEGSSQAAAIELDDSAEEEAIGDQPSADEAASSVESESENEAAGDSDEEMEDITEPTDVTVPEENDKDPEETTEPTFGDILAARHPGTIDIASNLEPDRSQQAEINNGLLTLPTGMSLGSVLTQSLRTNDRNLLEACLHTTDVDVVKNTIQRLESPLAGVLIGKIAERMSSRPGRYGDLQVWIQQLCVAHGAAIARMPEAKNKLKTLFKVLDQRAKTLTPLLLLKGKLDMLDAQLKFRQQLAAERANRQAQGGGMVYVEGEADNWDSDEDEEVGATKKGKQAKRLALEDLIDESGSEDDEEMPLANGISHSASSSDEEDDEENLGPKHERLVDDIAEEEDSESELDVEEGDSIAEEEESDDEEEDSDLDDFIDDGPVQVADDDALLDDAEVEEEVKKPEKKRRKY